MTTATRAFSLCSSRNTPPPAAVQPCRCQTCPAWNEAHHKCPSRPLYHARHVSVTGRGTTCSLVQSVTLAVLFCLLSTCRGARAGEVYGSSEILPAELLFDRSGPPPLPRMLWERREDESSSATASAHPSTSPTATTGGLTTAMQTGAVDLPRPFDTSLGNNFTASTCPAFFHSFLSSQAFKDCLPFSLLLQTSNSFFTASSSAVHLNQALDATCNVNFTQCSDLMSSLAVQIQEDSACGADLQMLNPVVSQAYNGFIAYQPLYHAACLTDSDGNYCFANAATNVSAPSSSYIYYLPLGVSLPGGSMPTCNKCLKNTMAVFAESAGNRTQPLRKDYASAAQQVQMSCGPRFVDAAVTGAAAATTAASAPLIGILGLFVLFASVANLY